MTCKLCARVNLAREGRAPHLIHEFENAYLFLGDHQYFEGYSVLVLKTHVREPHELSPPAQQTLFADLMRAGKAIQEAFRPWKLNYSCYGNQVPHVHWHIFPRYESDPDHKQHPWLHLAEFDPAQISDAERARRIVLIRDRLGLF